MEQKKNQQTKDSQEKKHSENLMQQMMSQPCDLAACGVVRLILSRRTSANNAFALPLP